MADKTTERSLHQAVLIKVPAFCVKSKTTENHVFGIKGGYGKITERLQKYHAKIIRKSCRSC